MGDMEPIANILAELREKHPRLAQTMKPLKSSRSCRGTYDWLLPEELERHMAEIVRIEDKRELCKDCNGLCRQHTHGYYEVVSPISTGLFHCTMQMCEWERVRREQKRLNRLIQSCGIPPAYKEKTFDDYIVSEGAENAVKVAKWLVEYPDKGAMFYGANRDRQDASGGDSGAGEDAAGCFRGIFQCPRPPDGHTGQLRHGANGRDSALCPKNTLPCAGRFGSGADE